LLRRPFHRRLPFLIVFAQSRSRNFKTVSSPPAACVASVASLQSATTSVARISALAYEEKMALSTTGP
jgi:hypothetical protein